MLGHMSNSNKHLELLQKLLYWPHPLACISLFIVLTHWLATISVTSGNSNTVERLLKLGTFPFWVDNLLYDSGLHSPVLVLCGDMTVQGLTGLRSTMAAEPRGFHGCGPQGKSWDGPQSSMHFLRVDQ